MNSRTTANPPALISNQQGAMALLDDLRADIVPLLAENGQSYDRLRSTLLIAIQQEPKILQCTADSIRREISKCAADGLVPDSKEAVLLPYYDSKAGAMLANYQPMVHGIIKRLRELGGVFSIVCKLVHEQDEFVLNEADPDSLVHKSDPFSKDRGKVVGGYAIFRDDQKRVMHLETMSLEDFERVRRASKAPDSPAWKIWTNEMYRKAVLRRGAKYISVNNDKIRALLERQDDMFDFSQPRVAERVNPFTGEVIEGEVVGGAHSAVPAVEDQRAEPEQRREPKAKEKVVQARREEGAPSANAQPADKPAAPPDLPDVQVALEDRERLVEGLTEVIEIALTPDVSPKDRQDNLKVAAPHLKDDLPEYLHPLVKACIDMTNWTIRRIRDGEPWVGDHAAFVHKLKTSLEVEKLNVSKYP